MPLSDSVNSNDPQPKPGIQNSPPMEAVATEGASSSQVVDISTPTETQNRPASDSTERNESRSSRALEAFSARRSPSATPINLMPRHTYPFPQIIKISLFGYTFWLYPVGPFQFLEFGREYIDEVQPNQGQHANEDVSQERFISTASTGSNPGASLKSTDIKTSGPAKITQTTMRKVKDETDRVSSHAQINKGSSFATIESSELKQSLEAANATFIKTEKITQTFDATDKSSTSNHSATKIKQENKKAFDSSEIIKRSKQIKQEKPFEDPLCRAVSSKIINGPVRYENNVGASARPADKPDLYVKKINHASGPVASCSSGAGTSGSHSVQEPLPVWRRKEVEQMTSAEMDQHFEYICEDDGWVPPRSEPSVQSRENELRRQAEEREDLEQERQMREFKEGIKPLVDYCKALLNGYIPSPEYSDDSEEDDVWLGPHKSRLTYRCPDIPDIRAIFNLPPIKRFYDIDVFCYENLMFISIRRPDARDNETVEVDGVAYVFPDYCIETPSRHGVFQASIILSGYIDNFCNTRASQQLPLDSFDRDFNSFLAMIFQNRNIYQTGMIRIRLNRR